MRDLFEATDDVVDVDWRVDDLLGLRVCAWGALPPSPLVPLRELVNVEHDLLPTSIDHKNLLPVIYVAADVAGREESPIYPVLELGRQIEALDPDGVSVSWVDSPYGEPGAALKWDGVPDGSAGVTAHATAPRRG